jgi:hypothetical protein
MNEPIRSRSARRRASSVLRPLAFLCSLSFAVAAQGTPRVAVSTTDDVPSAAGVAFPVADGDLVTVASGAEVLPFFAGGHFQAAAGFVPGDIDAFARLPGSRAGSAESLVFSLLSNEGGFLDGDLITLAHGGGAVLLVSELDLATALGAAGANIDVDALAYDAQGRILFSLADDLAATGNLDGDVLRLEPGFAGVTLLHSESDVQLAFTQVTGLTSAILDVQALEWNAGELWYAVQSPSRHDGSVLALGASARVVIDENDMGLGGSEIDALGLHRPGDEIPAFHLTPQSALAGDLVHVEVRGAPGSVWRVFMGGRRGFWNRPTLAGFGGLHIDPRDPWFVAIAAAHGRTQIALDGAGRFATDFHLPAGVEFGPGLVGELGWSFQALDLGARTMTAPFRIQKL